MSSASSAFTYTSVYTDSEPGRVFWGADEELSDRGSLRVIVYGYDGLPMLPPHDFDFVPEPMYPEYIPLEDEHILPVEEQPLPPVVSPTAKSPGYVAELDPEEDPEEYEDDETEDGSVDYPMDGGDDGDKDDGDSSGDNADDKDEDEKEEEEEHLALADSAIVIPTDELVSPPEGTEPVIPPSTDTVTTGARITVRLQAAISFPPEAEVERLLAMPTPSPSQLTSLSSPSAREHLAICTAPAALPSPPLPPPLHMPPPIDRGDDILEIEMPPHKRLCLSTLGFRYEVEESSTAMPTGGQGIDYGFFSTLDAEARRRGIGEVGYGIRDTWIDLAETVSEIAPMTRVDLLIEDMIAHQETIQIMEDEAYAAQEAWAHSIGLSQAVYLELQTHQELVYAYEFQLQTPQKQLQLQSTLIQTQHQLDETHFQMQQTEIAKLRETDRRHQAQMAETLRVMGDIRREMGDMQAELLALRGQPRRARQLGGDARVPNHQDAPRDVKFATCTLLDVALTWWNSQIRSLGPDAYSMTREVLEKKMTDKYCPQDEIKKLEIELWNLKVKENNVLAYTKRFQELTLFCTKFVADETEKIDKYVSELPDNIYKSMKASKPKTLDETIELANDLTDQKLYTYAERQSNSKRKADESFRNNHGHQQQDPKRQNVARVYNMGTGEKKPYIGNLPKCTKCLFYHNGPRHFKRDCPKLKNRMEKRGMHQDGCMRLEIQRRREMHQGTQIQMSSRVRSS
nr:reverse transcriptase domain-containing protein [Tanacetum cinerariifolium]